MLAGDLPVAESRREVWIAALGGKRAPAWMRRRGQAERAGGRLGRMRVWRVCGVVVRGEAMLRGRSGREVVKRIIRVSGGMGMGDGWGVVEGIALVFVLYVCRTEADGGLLAVEQCNGLWTYSMVNIRLNKVSRYVHYLAAYLVHLSMLYALLMCSDTLLYLPLRRETESFVAAKQEQSYPVLA